MLNDHEMVLLGNHLFMAQRFRFIKQPYNDYDAPKHLEINDMLMHIK